MSLQDKKDRLARLQKTEKDILELGQKTVDEDEQEIQRANLKQVQDSIATLEDEIKDLNGGSKRFRVRQYAARV